MNIQEYIKSTSFKGVLIGISVAIILLIVFQAGITVGEKRARFAGHFGQSFERNFINPQDKGFIGKPLPGNFDGMPGGHGAVGKIISINFPQVIVSGPDNLEKTIVINDSTEIREFRESIQKDKLKVGDFVVVIGSPDENGKIEAKLIRLLPPPPDTKESLNNPNQ